MKCPICESSIQVYCTSIILGKYNIQYYRCDECLYIFTEKPYWLQEAYNSAITKLDIGLIARNESMAPIVANTINRWFNPNGKFIDYGGGYGMLARMMRDRGFEYYRQDIYCENLYAQSFDISDVPFFKGELLTAFEVFEHLEDPVNELKKMLALSDSILFSTIVQPSEDVSPKTWWYFTPETGQHIALFNRKSIKALADRFGLNYNWNNQNIHLLSSKKINNNAFKAITHPRWGKLYSKLIGNRPTLLDKDFLYIREKVRNSY